MRWDRAWLAASVVILSLVVAAGSVGSTAPWGSGSTSVVIDGEFVVYERPLSGTDNLGPIDLANLFHPGGTGGGENLACTPDRLDVETNQIELVLEFGSGQVSGTGRLVARCQFHVGEGCIPEERTVLVDFGIGILDAEAMQIVGVARVSSPERITQIWGTPGGRTGHLEPASCTWGDSSLGPIEQYEMPWRLDLSTQPASGFLAADVVAGDPAQRVGLFEVTDPQAVDQVAAWFGPDDAPTDSADSASSEHLQSDGPAAGTGTSTDGTGVPATTVSDRGATPVFGPVEGEDEDVTSLWLAFLLLLTFLAAVYLGMRLRRRRHGARSAGKPTFRLSRWLRGG